MEKKIKRLKLFCNYLDVLVGVVLMALGAIGGFSCFSSDNAGQVFAFALLAFIFIPIFIVFIIFGIILIVYGILNSIKIAKDEKLVTKKTGASVLMVLEVVCMILSLFFAVVFADFLQNVRLAGTALIFVSIVFKMVYLFKLSKLNTSDLNEKESENNVDDTRVN